MPIMTLLPHHSIKGNLKLKGSRSLYAVLTLLTICMGIAALFQLAFLRRIEDRPPAGSKWENDVDAKIIRVGHVKPEIINWSPRIIFLHNFLSVEECEHLKAVAVARLAKSTVVDNQTGKGVESKVRTSSGMFLNSQDRQHYLVQAIEKRISVYSMVPVENGELLQILRYEPDQFYKPHHDYFSDEFNLKRGGQRVATMLMYLSDVAEGGETIFPWVGDKECSCGGEMKKGLCVKPMKGDAILFWNSKLDGTTDPDSLHGSCSVLRGEKWSATKWLRQYAFT